MFSRNQVRFSMGKSDSDKLKHNGGLYKNIKAAFHWLVFLCNLIVKNFQ